MKKLLVLIAAVPVLALFGGIGVLAWRIAETWNAATTQGLVTGLTVVCGGGALVVGILLALIVGVPLAIRAYGEGGASRRAWGASIPSGWDDAPRLAPQRRNPSLIDTQWRSLPDSTPPWGATRGGAPQLLPPPEQDERFGLDR
jgi:hypothetical protein